MYGSTTAGYPVTNRFSHITTALPFAPEAAVEVLPADLISPFTLPLHDLQLHQAALRALLPALPDLPLHQAPPPSLLLALPDRTPPPYNLPFSPA
jgi:hypothetical protein